LQKPRRLKKSGEKNNRLEFPMHSIFQGKALQLLNSHVIMMCDFSAPATLDFWKTLPWNSGLIFDEPNSPAIDSDPFRKLVVDRATDPAPLRGNSDSSTEYAKSQMTGFRHVDVKRPHSLPRCFAINGGKLAITALTVHSPVRRRALFELTK
jgi:hypothetical protein